MSYHDTIGMANIQNIDNTRCWQGCEVMQRLWKANWQFLTKLNIALPYDAGITFVGVCLNWKFVYIKNLHIHVNCITARLVSNSCLLTGEWQTNFGTSRQGNIMRHKRDTTILPKGVEESSMQNTKRRRRIWNIYIEFFLIMWHPAKGETINIVKRSGIAWGLGGRCE